MTTRDHLKDFHTRAGEHHARMARIHQSALNKAREMEANGTQEFLESAMLEHTSMAQHHVECAKSLAQTSKAMGLSDDRVMPDLISGVLPETASNIRGVPRYGQRALGDISEVEIDPTLSKVFGDD
jgi:hypothetical protein